MDPFSEQSDPLTDVLDVASTAMWYARQGQLDRGYSYLLKMWELTSAITDPIKKSRFRSVLQNFEKRWRILPQ